MFQVFSFKTGYLEELGKAHREVAEQINSGFFEREGASLLLSWKKPSETSDQGKKTSISSFSWKKWSFSTNYFGLGSLSVPFLLD